MEGKHCLLCRGQMAPAGLHELTDRRACWLLSARLPAWLTRQSPCRMVASCAQKGLLTKQDITAIYSKLLAQLKPRAAAANAGLSSLHAISSLVLALAMVSDRNAEAVQRTAGKDLCLVSELLHMQCTQSTGAQARSLAGPRATARCLHTCWPKLRLRWSASPRRRFATAASRSPAVQLLGRG